MDLKVTAAFLLISSGCQPMDHSLNEFVDMQELRESMVQSFEDELTNQEIHPDLYEFYNVKGQSKSGYCQFVYTYTVSRELPDILEYPNLVTFFLNFDAFRELDYTAEAGDAIYIDADGDKKTDHLGMVISPVYEDGEVVAYNTIEGDVWDSITKQERPIDQVFFFGAIVPEMVYEFYIH